MVSRSVRILSKGKKQRSHPTVNVEEQLRKMLESATKATIVVDGDQKIILFNQAAERMFGYPAPEVLGRSLDILFPGYPKDAYRQQFRKSAAAPVVPWSIGHQKGLVGRRKDGSDFSLEVLWTKLGNAQGAFFVTLILDLSEHVQKQKTLRQMQEHFQALTENALDGVVLLDLDGQVKFMNPAGWKIFGTNREDDPTIRVTDYIHPDELPVVLSTVTSVIANPTQNPSLVGRIRQKGDGWLWVEGTFTNLLNVKNIGAIEVNFRNITERKDAEDALLKRDQQMKALVTSLDDIVFELDGQGTYLQTWATNETLLALPKSQLLGKRVVDVLGEEIGCRYKDAIRRVLQSGKTETVEYPLDVEAGRRWFIARISPIVKGRGSPTSVVALVRDITNWKLSEMKIKEQLDRLTALRELDQLIVSTLDLGICLNELLARTVKLLAVDAVDVLLLDPVQNTLQYRIGVGFHTKIIQNAHVKLGQSLAGKVAMERRIVQIQNSSLDGRDPFLGDDLKEEGFVRYIGAPLTAKGKVIGVLEAFDRSVRERNQDWLNFFGVLAGQAAVMVNNAQLFNDLQVTNSELTMAYDETIEGWSQALDLRDKETEGHSRRVTELTLRLARGLGFGEEEMIHLRRGALLHDIGKIGVPDLILQKPGSLTEIEWDQMRKHPQYAYDMLAPITYLRKAIDIPYCHHEHFDGTGYPRGLKGEEIPLAARVFAVVDMWDALTSDRPYRKAWPQKKALNYIRKQAGRLFDPNVVEIFLKEIPYVC